MTGYNNKSINEGIVELLECVNNVKRAANIGELKTIFHTYIHCISPLESIRVEYSVDEYWRHAESAFQEYRQKYPNDEHSIEDINFILRPSDCSYEQLYVRALQKLITTSANQDDELNTVQDFFRNELAKSDTRKLRKLIARRLLQLTENIEGNKPGNDQNFFANLRKSILDYISR
jgi:hypothetical protein